MTNPMYNVASLGFEEHERQVLRTVLRMTEQRTPVFTPFVRAPGTYPDVVIVNYDNPAGLGSWQAYRRTLAGKKLVSEVRLSRQQPTEAKYWVGRPILASRLIALLERVVTEEQGFIPTGALMSGGAPVDHDQTASVLDFSRPMAKVAYAGAPAGNSSRTVLVVDDSLPVRIQMKAALKGLVDKVDFAETGEFACELIEHSPRPYDVVFLDVILPGMDGYQVCRKLRQSGGYQKTPVVMLTSNSSPADRVKGKLAGCDTYLIKPVKPEIFESVISEFLRLPAKRAAVAESAK